ncbi:MAG TPA: ATP-binding cassette domain-containing protein, partial [Chitinophagaceae bacterium]|nr:ATP-binding cassette domain-containing protein [Chitinophagaceae bacterium]
MLRINNISLIRNNRHLLRDVSFEVKPGELAVVLGSNGAGKSSLLKCISREWQPQQGSISWNDKPLAGWKDKELAKVR